MDKGILAYVPLVCKNFQIFFKLKIKSWKSNKKWVKPAAQFVFFKAINRLNSFQRVQIKLVSCAEIDRAPSSARPVTWRGRGSRLHVEALAPGLQGSLISEVHVDVGGYQIVHLVALFKRGKQSDMKETNKQKKKTNQNFCCLSLPVMFHTGISSPSPNFQ